MRIPLAHRVASNDSFVDYNYFVAVWLEPRRGRRPPGVVTRSSLELGVAK